MTSPIDATMMLLAGLAALYFLGLGVAEFVIGVRHGERSGGEAEHGDGEELHALSHQDQRPGRMRAVDQAVPRGQRPDQSRQGRPNNHDLRPLRATASVLRPDRGGVGIAAVCAMWGQDGARLIGYSQITRDRSLGAAQSASCLVPAFSGAD